MKSQFDALYDSLMNEEMSFDSYSYDDLVLMAVDRWREDDATEEYIRETYPTKEDLVNALEKDVDSYEDDEYEEEPREDSFRDDVDADADTLASAGYGTDEDYGDYGGGDDY
jgi:hypothetical protein